MNREQNIQPDLTRTNCISSDNMSFGRDWGLTLIVNAAQAAIEVYLYHPNGYRKDS